MTAIGNTNQEKESQSKEEKPNFPICLFKMPYSNLIKKMIKIHPALLFLFYKRFTAEVIVDIVKSLIPLYHQKKDWFNALSHLSRLGLITYDDAVLHRIEPEKVHITKLGRTVLDTWIDSELFRAFKWLEIHSPEIFKETELFVKCFNDNFRVYESQKKNVVFTEKLPSKSYVDIPIYCGFCGEHHDTFIDYDTYHRYFSNGCDYFIEGVSCNSYHLSFVFKLNFSKKEFSIFVNYLDANADLPKNVQGCISDTIMKLNLRNHAMMLKNVDQSQTKERPKKRKKSTKIKQIVRKTASTTVESLEIEPEVLETIPQVSSKAPLTDVKVEKKISPIYKTVESPKIYHRPRLRPRKQKRYTKRPIRMETKPIKMCHYTEASFELFIQYLCHKARKLIDRSIKEELTESISQGVFEIEIKIIKERINKAKNDVLDELLSNEEEPFLKVFTTFYFQYFPERLEEAKIFLEKERIKAEEERIERGQLDEQILDYIDRFFENQSDRIYWRCIGRKQKNLVKYVVEDLLNTAFERSLIQDDIFDRQLYKEQFKIQLPLRITSFFENLENLLRRYYMSQTLFPEFSIREFISSNKERLVFGVLSLALSAFLAGFLYWYFSLPPLENFAFFDENMWIAPVLVVLVGIDVVFLIQVFKGKD